jgi:hypothetical protein
VENNQVCREKNLKIAKNGSFPENLKFPIENINKTS